VEAVIPGACLFGKGDGGNAVSDYREAVERISTISGFFARIICQRCASSGLAGIIRAAKLYLKPSIQPGFLYLAYSGHSTA
jgi:hypothetical protein